MDKNLLDNMSGQELKEMIDDEIIALEELDNTALEKLLDFETDMLCVDTGDMTTIRRCSELLNRRNDSEILNKDRVISIIDKAASERVIIVDEDKTHESKAKVIRGKHITLRRIGLVAAIVAVLMSVTVLVAAAFGVNILEYISKIVRQDEGAEINVEQFTFHNGGEIETYSTIGEMVESESLDIMYPTKFPKNINIHSVIVNESEHGNKQIQIITNDNNVRVFVEQNVQKTEETFDGNNIYEFKGKTYYIFEENGSFALCYYKNCYYTIQANSYDDLILIINNMKE